MLAKEATTDDAEASDGGESVEPEASESDREVEVETKEEPDVEEVKAHEDVATEEYEDVVEEAAEEEAAESSKGQGKGHVASTGSRTGASPVGTTGDVGTTVSSSSAMHNLLVKSLSSILDGAMPEVGQVGGPDPARRSQLRGTSSQCFTKRKRAVCEGTSDRRRHRCRA